MTWTEWPETNPERQSKVVLKWPLKQSWSGPVDWPVRAEVFNDGSETKCNEPKWEILSLLSQRKFELWQKKMKVWMKALPGFFDCVKVSEFWVLLLCSFWNILELLRKIHSSVKTERKHIIVTLCDMYFFWQIRIWCPFVVISQFWWYSKCEVLLCSRMFSNVPRMFLECSSNVPRRFSKAVQR